MEPAIFYAIWLVLAFIVMPLIAAFAYDLETRPNRKRRTRKARR